MVSKNGVGIYNENALKIERKFTSKNKSPFDMFDYEIRTSAIKNPDGSIVYENNSVEVPSFWSQVATDILAQKYFKRALVPQFDSTGKPILDKKGNQVLGGETSIKQVAKRLAFCWRAWGEQNGYFASKDDADAFEDELIFMLINQSAAPNSPQWFNTGLFLCYDITGSPTGMWYVDPADEKLKLTQNSYERPQPHACFIQEVKDDLVSEGGIYDLLTKEARLFKFGSGTGTNFSSLRSIGEKLSGGGYASGVMSYLKILDRSAGSVKSGGLTRRAAKMVILDVDHPEIETFVDWKMNEEKKVASLIAGSKICNFHLHNISNVIAEEKSADVSSSPKLQHAIKVAAASGVPLNYIHRVLTLASRGIYDFSISVMDSHYESEAYVTVSGQNSNNSVRLTNKFLDSVEKDLDWNLLNRVDSSINKTIKARYLWDKIAFAAWNSADPGIQFHDTINEWHTCPKDGEIVASNPCSEYMFLNDTACNLASINLAKFFDNQSSLFDVDSFLHAVRLWTIVLEISVLMASFPGKNIAERSYLYRTLGLGYANIGSILMRSGIPYDSDKARTFSASISALLTGKSYETSAEMASFLGPFKKYDSNKEDMLRVIRNHRRASYNAPDNEYESLTVKPVGINPKFVDKYLLDAARTAWDKALELGEKFGFRNAQVSVIAPTGTIGLVMDCDTTGIEPDFALVKFKKLSGGGYFKIVNSSVPIALNKIGYSKKQVDDIVAYCVGHGTIKNAPHINPEFLKSKGFSAKAIKSIDAEAKNAFDIKFIFNKFVIGEDELKKVFPSSDLSNPSFDILFALGLSEKQIDEANIFVCGSMTIEGAPELKKEHLPIFDCANKCGKFGKRFINFTGHLEMMGAVQPFISGAISKTINMPVDATLDDVKFAYKRSWELMIKANAIYRDGSKLSQPLNSVSDESADALLSVASSLSMDDLFGPKELNQKIEKQLFVAQKRRLPSRRKGYIQAARIGGHKVYLRTGEYDDGTLGEIFIDMYKEGASYRSLLSCFAIAVSKALQHGVPLEEFVEAFTFTRFEPSGMVLGHEYIKSATSILDFVFRSVGHEYLGRTDFLQVKPLADSNVFADKKNNRFNDKKVVEETDADTAGMDNLNSSLSVIDSVDLDDASKLATQTTLNEDSVKISKIKVSDENVKILEARSKGYVGEPCAHCGSMKVKRNGSCTVCEDCGETSGCS